jgi:hypothetical protein
MTMPKRRLAFTAMLLLAYASALILYSAVADDAKRASDRQAPGVAAPAADACRSAADSARAEQYGTDVTDCNARVAQVKADAAKADPLRCGAGFASCAYRDDAMGLTLAVPPGAAVRALGTGREPFDGTFFRGLAVEAGTGTPAVVAALSAGYDRQPEEGQSLLHGLPTLALDGAGGLIKGVRAAKARYDVHSPRLGRVAGRLALTFYADTSYVSSTVHAVTVIPTPEGPGANLVVTSPVTPEIPFPAAGFAQDGDMAAFIAGLYDAQGAPRQLDAALLAAHEALLRAITLSPKR